MWCPDDASDAEQEIADRQTVIEIAKETGALRLQAQAIERALAYIAEDAKLGDVLTALSQIRAATDRLTVILDELE